LKNQLIALGRLSRGLQAAIGVILLVLGAVAVISYQLYKQMRVEAYYRSEFGPEWKQRYEERFGAASLSENKSKLAVAGISIPTIGGLSWLLYRETIGKRSRESRSSRRRSRRRRA
jgi:hypothetical protein